MQYYCENIALAVILVADKLKSSTDKLSSHYINVKFYEKSVKAVTTQNRFLKNCDKTRSRTATNRLCGLCSAWSGTTASFLFAPHRAKFCALGFVTHGFCQKSDRQRKAPAKRIAFAEVHQFCVIVFDFLKYSILLLRQRSG